MMDTNLIIQDMDHFLDKYTRFMTKDIYITNSMYHCFLGQYQYLYHLLEKNRFLYNDNPHYQKIMKMLQNKNQLIKLHNQKYLKKALKEYNTFFNTIPFHDKLDNRKRMLILSEEDHLFTVQPKNQLPLIIGKIKFLEHFQNVSLSKILVLTSQPEESRMIETALAKEKLILPVKNLKEYGLALLKDDEKVLEYNQKYDILTHYLIYELFPQKDLFQSFYQAFSKFIYLNKDYKEFDTFYDYHNYMYKRKFLSSKLSQKKFNEQEVKKRSTHLRTIQNESMKQKEEVAIANFLYLNSIPYQYDTEKSLFSIQLDEKNNKIKFLNQQQNLEEENADVSSTIYLYTSYTENKTYLEVLAYELIKRRYPLELVSDEILYKKLKDTTIENYFSELIHKYLIPTIDYYETTKTLKDTTLTNAQQQEFLNLYQNYDTYLKKHHYLKESDLLKRIEQELTETKYQYIILIGDISLSFPSPTMTIVADYPENTLLKENIKLFYDYKKYLYQNQSLPIPYTYLSKQEIKKITTSFLKENLAMINKSLEENTIPIKIYYYEDNNRLHIYQNISNCCDKIIEENSENLLMAFRQLKDMNILIQNNLFTKLNKTTLLSNRHEKIPCEEIATISKIYNTIVLPYLITDNFHEDFLNKDYLYYLKVMLYIAMNKCRTNLIILCPRSRKDELDQILCHLKNPVYSE